MYYFRLLETLNKKRKKSFFYEEKSLVGLAPGRLNYKCICEQTACGNISVSLILTFFLAVNNFDQYANCC
jgi:hypothetical protein